MVAFIRYSRCPDSQLCPVGRATDWPPTAASSLHPGRADTHGRSRRDPLRPIDPFRPTAPRGRHRSAPSPPPAPPPKNGAASSSASSCSPRSRHPQSVRLGRSHTSSGCASCGRSQPWRRPLSRRSTCSRPRSLRSPGQQQGAAAAVAFALRAASKPTGGDVGSSASVRVVRADRTIRAASTLYSSGGSGLALRAPPTGTIGERWFPPQPGPASSRRRRRPWIPAAREQERASQFHIASTVSPDCVRMAIDDTHAL